MRRSTFVAGLLASLLVLGYGNHLSSEGSSGSSGDGGEGTHQGGKPGEAPKN